ncbi:MAG: hypothetical protein IJP38_07315 [Oscillospiraceae bacterium]|nr:hypothetical protein [Oscillospiraceae bacterium]
MADYIRPGTCGACKEFEFEGNNKKGYCRRYGAYYWDNDSCNNYEEDDRRLSSGGSSCFLTTACCQYKNLPDDCYELTVLRKFRDEYLMNTKDGKELVEKYYEIAPGIVEKITVSVRKEKILEDVYAEIGKIISLIEAAKVQEDVDAYKDMVIILQNELCK